MRSAGASLGGAVTAAVCAAWLGGALLLAAVVAPAAFAVLPTRALAGLVVGRVLPVVFGGGIVTGAVVALLSTRGGTLARWRAAAGLVLSASCAVAQLGVAPRIARLRDTIGPAVEALAPEDARRAAFGRLHAASVGLLGLGMLAAAAITVLGILAQRARS